MGHLNWAELTAGAPALTTIVSIAAVQALTSLSRSSIYRCMAAGRFPKPVTLGESRKGWVLEEIHDWNRKQIENRDRGGQVT